jgi:hypothetical protein
MDKLSGRASYGQHFQPDATPATPIPILSHSLNQLDRDACLAYPSMPITAKKGFVLSHPDKHL